jgi:GNAT superfamily N-acetyltransferase
MPGTGQLKGEIMSEVTVRPVTTRADEQAFLRMPWAVYDESTSWTPPLWREHVRYFDPVYNAELQHIDFERFVAWRGETPVGTIIAHVNHAFNDFQKANDGWFGQFELLDDREAADALLQTAEEWLRAKGVEGIYGPATYSTNSEIGLLVEGFDQPHSIMTPWAMPYYQGFVEANGFQKYKDLWSWYFDGNAWGGLKADRLPEKLTRIVGKIKERKNLTLRQVDMRHFDEEVARAKVIYNQAWEENWAFVPMSEVEIDHLAEELKPMVDPHMILFVELEGEPVGFGLPLPDVYQPLRKARCKPGEPHWFQLARLIWHWKVRRDVDRIRAWALGVLKEYRGTGVDALLYFELLKRGLPRGYLNVEMSWILEDNDMMNRAFRMLEARINKVWRVYYKPLT